jgi:TPP-dependent indolepyruvate ferredoxin oxidoreductase alpha subunit
VKNVGVNACADPLLQATAQGLISGVLLVAGDDPDARSSQTAQDSRYYGELAELPVIEPDCHTCFAGVEAALQASERFSRVAMLRLTPHLLDAPADRSVVPREDRKGRISDRSWTMHGRVTAAESLYGEMFDWADASQLNRWQGDPAGVGPAPGSSRIVTVHPPPRRAARCRDVNELGRPFVREHRGLFPPAPGGSPGSMADRGYYRTFCRDCPFITVLDIMREKQLPFICDAGCSILGMTPPYELGVASYGMGSSIAVAARSTHIALIGDYALLHSGLNALIDVYEKRIPLLTIVFVNRCTAMTGKQPSPDPTPYIAWAAPEICRADDATALTRVIRHVDRPVTVIVEGTCPAGAQHQMIPLDEPGGSR